MCCLTIVCKNVPLPNKQFADSGLQCSLTICDVDRSGSNHLHKLAKGLPTYTLRTESGRTVAREVSRVRSRAPMTLSLVRGRNYV